MAFVKQWQSYDIVWFNANGPNEKGDFDELDDLKKVRKIIGSVSPNTEVLAYVKSFKGNYLIVTAGDEESAYGRSYHYYMWDSAPTRKEIISVFRETNPFEGDEMFQESSESARQRFVASHTTVLPHIIGMVSSMQKFEAPYIHGYEFKVENPGELNTYFIQLQIEGDPKKHYWIMPDHKMIGLVEVGTAINEYWNLNLQINQMGWLPLDKGFTREPSKEFEGNPFEGDEMFQEKLSPSLQEAHDRYVNKKFNDILFEKSVMDNHLMEIDVQHTFGFDEPETVEIEDYPMPKEEMTPEQREEWIDRIIEEINEFAKGASDFYDDSYFADTLADSWEGGAGDTKWKDVFNETSLPDEVQNELLYRLKAKKLSVEDLADDIYNAASIHITGLYSKPYMGFALANWTMEEDELPLPDEIINDLFQLDKEEYDYVSKHAEVTMPDAEDLHHGLNPPDQLLVTISVGVAAWLIINDNDLRDIIETETSDVDMTAYLSPIEPKKTTDAEEVMENPFEGDEMFSESVEGETFEIGDTVEILDHGMTSLIGWKGEIDAIHPLSARVVIEGGGAIVWVALANLKKIKISPFEGDEMFQESTKFEVGDTVIVSPPTKLLNDRWWKADLEYLKGKTATIALVGNEDDGFIDIEIPDDPNQKIWYVPVAALKLKKRGASEIKDPFAGDEMFKEGAEHSVKMDDELLWELYSGTEIGKLVQQKFHSTNFRTETTKYGWVLFHSKSNYIFVFRPNDDEGIAYLGSSTQRIEEFFSNLGLSIDDLNVDLIGEDQFTIAEYALGPDKVPDIFPSFPSPEPGENMKDPFAGDEMFNEATTSKYVAAESDEKSPLMIDMAPLPSYLKKMCKLTIPDIFAADIFFWGSKPGNGMWYLEMKKTQDSKTFWWYDKNWIGVKTVQKILKNTFGMDVPTDMINWGVWQYVNPMETGEESPAQEISVENPFEGDEMFQEAKVSDLKLMKTYRTLALYPDKDPQATVSPNFEIKKEVSGWSFNFEGGPIAWFDFKEPDRLILADTMTAHVGQVAMVKLEDFWAITQDVVEFVDASTVKLLVSGKYNWVDIVLDDPEEEEPDEPFEGDPFSGDEMFQETTEKLQTGDRIKAWSTSGWIKGIIIGMSTSFTGVEAHVDWQNGEITWEPVENLVHDDSEQHGGGWSPFEGDEMFQESASRDYWDANLEYNPLRKKNYDDDTSAGAFLAYKIENAGDIIRELGKSQWIDMGYIMEKINKIKDSLSNRRDWIIDQLSPTEQKILQKMRSQVVEIPEDLPGVVEVKSMLLGIIDRNVQRVEQYAELAEEAIRRYLKEKE